MNDINRSAAQIAADARLRAGFSQRELAARARTTQAAIARIEGGRTFPSLQTLARLVRAAGFELRVDLVKPQAADTVVAAYKRDIDRSLLRQNLTKSVDERVRSLTALARFASEARRAGSTVRQGARRRK